MRFIYSWLVRCAVPVALAAILWRGLRDRSYWQGLTERLGLGRALSAQGIWLHAVSLGEMSAAAPLLEALRSRHPEIPLLVTTATPAGRARALALFADRSSLANRSSLAYRSSLADRTLFPDRASLTEAADVRFLPYDTPGSVRRFLARTRPRIAIIMETELWPNLLRECERGRIPVLLASARLSVRSVSRYRRFSSLFRGVFTENLTVAAQSAADAERFKSIGAAAERTLIVGNVKFDLQVDAGNRDAGRQLRAAYGATRPVWIAGSTHAGEEEQLLDAHAVLLKARPSAVLLLVPRHKDRFAAVAELLSRRGIKFARRSQMARGEQAAPGEQAARDEDTVRLPGDTPVLLVDTVGELVALYASADVAFVGGSLAAIGGHNLLEPAALGLPVLTGPSFFNNREIAQLLLDRGAALQVDNAQDLAAVLARLLDDPKERQRIGRIGQQIVAANRGSVERLLALIEPSLRERRSAAAAQAYP